MSLLDLLLLGWALIATLTALYQRWQARRLRGIVVEALDLARAANAGWAGANDALIYAGQQLAAIQQAMQTGAPLPLWTPPHDERLN